MHLTKRLRAFVDDARRSGIASAVVVDGSYITAKDEPEDIDLIVALRPDFDLGQVLRPFEYNIRSRRMIKHLYRFDVFVEVDGSAEYDGWGPIFYARQTGRSWSAHDGAC
jgi:hypothetical protein